MVENSNHDAEGTCLDSIEGRLRMLSVDELIELALMYDESPMRYFSRENLLQFGYPKRHYVG